MMIEGVAAVIELAVSIMGVTGLYLLLFFKLKFRRVIFYFSLSCSLIFQQPIFSPNTEQKANESIASASFFSLFLFSFFSFSLLSVHRSSFILCFIVITKEVIHQSIALST
jgi:hypothetical protein